MARILGEGWKVTEAGVQGKTRSWRNFCPVKSFGFILRAMGRY